MAFQIADRHISKLMTGKIADRDLHESDVEMLRHHAYYVYLDGRTKRAKQINKRADQIAKIVKREDAKRLTTMMLARAQIAARQSKGCAALRRA